MGNTNGLAYSLTVLTPVIPGHEQPLKNRVEKIPLGLNGAYSPFNALTTTHFARLVLIPQFVDEGPPQRPVTLRSQYLLYCSVFTAPLEDHLEDLRRRLQPTTDEIWGHCVNYPSAAAPGPFAQWFRHNQIDTAFFYAGYPDVDLAEVRDAVALRDRLIGFAVHGQGLSERALLAKFQEEFVTKTVRT